MPEDREHDDNVRDLTGWLRAVRPDTLADHAWTNSPQADEVLAAVHQSAPREARRARRNARLRLWAPAPVLAAAAVTTVLVATAGGGGTPPGVPPLGGPLITNPTQPVPGARPAAQLLSNFDSCGDALAGLRSHAAAHPNLTLQSNFPLYPRAAAVDGFAADGDAASAPKSTTTTPTNVQEAGVDEPDLVKTSDGSVVTLTDGVLRVIDPSSQQVTGTVDLTVYSGSAGGQLLVGDGHALVVLNDPGPTFYGGPLSYYPRDVEPSALSRSTLVFVDLASAQVTGTLRLDGAYVDARQVGSTVRLVARSTPTIHAPHTTRLTLAQKQQVIRRAPLSAWLPRYSLTVDGRTTSKAVPCQQVSHPNGYTGASLLTVYTLDLADLSADPQPITLAADGDTIYATPSSLYVASNPSWNYAQVAGQHTQVHRFDITGAGPPVYLGSAWVAGRLLNSYSLSEYDGSLRIATTQGGEDGSTGDTNSVVVLDAATLHETGHVDGLGTDERIYAVRFLGPVAYVVTYRQTDPLYTLDLSDPAHPREVSALELQGYSGYLHDVGDGRLLGVGQDTTGGTVHALQVSLFDVSSPAHPSRVARVVLPGTPGESDFDPHLFLYEPDSGLVVVPVQTWNARQSGRVLVLHLDGRTLRPEGTLANPAGSTSTDDGLGIQHSMVVDGRLWTVSGSGVLVSDPTSLHRDGWIAFDAP